MPRSHQIISVIPTRYFLGRPDIGEEMHISIEKGKTLIIRLMAVGPVVEGQAQRDVWFEVNGEVYISLLFIDAHLGYLQTVGSSCFRRRQELCCRNRLAGESNQ